MPVFVRYNRKILPEDFSAGRIELLKPSNFGPMWAAMEADTAYRLESFLKKLGKPFVITSAYRTKEQNAAAGGASNSRHLSGEAVDVWLLDQDFYTEKNLTAVFNIARSVGFNGVGVYKGDMIAPYTGAPGGPVHLDTRPTWWTWGAIYKKTPGGKTQKTFIETSKIVKTLAITGGASVGVFLVVFLLALAGRSKIL